MVDPSDDRTDDVGAVDWFGHPLRRPAAPVPCPACGEPFTERDALAAHLAERHQIQPRPRRSFEWVRRWWRTLGHLPLWFVLVLDTLLVAIVVTALWPVNPWYAAYAGGLATFPLVLFLSARLSHR